MWVGCCGAACLSRFARLKEVGGWKQWGQEDPFQISPSFSQCQTSRLRTKYLLHQRAPFCEGQRTEWAWMNRLKTDPILAQPVAHLVPSALSHPVRPMIPENRYSWCTNLTHVSHKAKHKTNYTLRELQISRSFTMADFQQQQLTHVRTQIPTIRSTCTHKVKFEPLILSPDQDLQATSECHFSLPVWKRMSAVPESVLTLH